MKIKPGVIMPDKIQMRKVLLEADAIWKEEGVELVVTSGKDGEHSAGSLHYYGYAVDLRSRYFDEDTRAWVADRLRKALGDGYDVINEASHIHVEYDAILNAY